MRSVRLLTTGCLELRPCFAHLDTLIPSVLEFFVTSTPAVSEPRTAATAATAFARFPDGGAFGAYGTDGRRRRRDCYWAKRNKQTQNM